MKAQEQGARGVKGVLTIGVCVLIVAPKQCSYSCCCAGYLSKLLIKFYEGLEANC